MGSGWGQTIVGVTSLLSSPSPSRCTHSLIDVPWMRSLHELLANWSLPQVLLRGKKQESSRKPSTSALLTTPKPLTVWITTNRGKFFKRREYQTTWPASWEICMQVRKQQLEPDMQQRTGSKLGKEYVKAVYCHPACLTSMQSTSCEMLGWMKDKLESRLPGEISVTLDMQMTPPLWQKAKRN